MQSISWAVAGDISVASKQPQVVGHALPGKSKSWQGLSVLTNSAHLLIAKRKKFW